VATEFEPNRSLPRALTIAGLDPSGGAGVIADVGAFSAFGCSPNAAITSLTFQNATQVFGAEHVSAAAVREQMMAIVADHQIKGAKTGMLPTVEIVCAVAGVFRETDLPAPVVDPVMRSTSGYSLIDAGALETLIAELLPLARVITPNIPEAERLTGLRIVDAAGMRQAALAIRELGARAVLIKGGHLRKQEAGSVRSEAQEAIDVLDDDGSVTVFRDAWIDVSNVRGTGCMLSAAIAACLAKGMTLAKAVAEAKRFVGQVISGSGVSSSSP
jgi:hydroxymethylpyrimidine kinase/phosphomethylpyrimidine kinase